MRMEDAEISDAFTPALRPFNHDDADYLGVHPVALGVLNDFVFHAVNRNVNGSDELYSSPTSETRLDVERSCERLQAIRLIQQRKAGLNLLARYDGTDTRARGELTTRARQRRTRFLH